MIYNKAMSDKKIKKGLGRGFESLISSEFNKDLLLSTDEHIKKLSLADIVPREKQPRTLFDEDKINELAKSISIYGVIVPLIVSPLPENKYQIIAGERRWRAAKSIGLNTVPVVIRTLQEIEKAEIALIENVQRVDLSPIEQALSIARLHEEFSVSYDEISKRLGKATSTVNNIVRLLNLPDFAKEALKKGEISEGHARAILALKDSTKDQENLLRSILKFGWSVRQAESYVVSLNKEGANKHSKAKSRVMSNTPETRHLSKKLKTEVSIKRMAKGGFLEIRFKTNDELESIINRIG